MFTPPKRTTRNTHRSRSPDTGIGLGLDWDLDEEFPDPEPEFSPRDTVEEDVLLVDTPGRSTKRKGTPDKPSTPAKHKEGQDGTPKPPSSLRNYFVKEPLSAHPSATSPEPDRLSNVTAAPTQQKTKTKARTAASIASNAN